jgi:homopolymeric O-antigen transport system ATP-binding protein
MSQPSIEVTGLAKVYNIGHERQANPGTMTFRDTLVRVIHKPIELITGHKLKKEKFWALKGVDFEVLPGDVIGIVGRNGSGKSTLLKILSRIVEPTEGQAILRGKVASLLEVGTGFHPELTGRENIYFNGAILGMSRKEIRAKFDEIVAFSEIEQFLDTAVKYYSSGMYVRLAFAVAAHLDPDILIIDEVLAVGDAAFQEKCLGKMKDVASHGRTVLFVSHNMASVKELCTKAIWMDKGEIKEQGDLDTVTGHYAESSASESGDLAKQQRSAAVTGEAKITRIAVTNDGDKTDAIDSKQPMQITFEIEAKEAVKNVVAHCGLNFAGRTVLRFMSEFTDTTFDLKKGKNTLTCAVKPTDLAGGVYSLDVSILHPGHEIIGHIDQIPDAVTFTVANYKTPSGSQVNQPEAYFYAEHTWQQK